MIFDIRPDFDDAKSPHATLFAKFVRRKTKLAPRSS